MSMSFSSTIPASTFEAPALRISQSNSPIISLSKTSGQPPKVPIARTIPNGSRPKLPTRGKRCARVHRPLAIGLGLTAILFSPSLNSSIIKIAAQAAATYTAPAPSTAASTDQQLFGLGLCLPSGQPPESTVSFSGDDSAEEPCIPVEQKSLSSISTVSCPLSTLSPVGESQSHDSSQSFDVSPLMFHNSVDWFAFASPGIPVSIPSIGQQIRLQPTHLSDLMSPISPLPSPVFSNVKESSSLRETLQQNNKLNPLSITPLLSPGSLQSSVLSPHLLSIQNSPLLSISGSCAISNSFSSHAIPSFPAFTGVRSGSLLQSILASESRPPTYSPSNCFIISSPDVETSMPSTPIEQRSSTPSESISSASVSEVIEILPSPTQSMHLPPVLSDLMSPIDPLPSLLSSDSHAFPLDSYLPSIPSSDSNSLLSYMIKESLTTKTSKLSVGLGLGMPSTHVATEEPKEGSIPRLLHSYLSADAKQDIEQFLSSEMQAGSTLPISSRRPSTVSYNPFKVDKFRPRSLYSIPELPSPKETNQQLAVSPIPIPAIQCPPKMCLRTNGKTSFSSLSAPVLESFNPTSHGLQYPPKILLRPLNSASLPSLPLSLSLSPTPLNHNARAAPGPSPRFQFLKNIWRRATGSPPSSLRLNSNPTSPPCVVRMEVPHNLGLNIRMGRQPVAQADVVSSSSIFGASLF